MVVQEDRSLTGLRTTPWQHQVDALDMIRRQPGTMLAYDMGTGKSLCVVMTVAALVPQRTLICCPKAVVEVWPKEFDKHADCNININVLPLGEGPLKKRAELLQSALSMKTPIVAVINYDVVYRSPIATILNKTVWDLIVCDESHRIKSAAGRQSRYLSRLATKARKRVCLTGTPMAHSPLDVYGQYRFLDPCVFGTSYTRFKNEYAVLGGPNRQWVQGFKNLDDLNEKFYSIGKRVSKSDVLDLPPAIHETISVDLDPETKRVYRDLENDFVAEIKGRVVSVSNAMVKITRLQQVTSGYSPIDDSDDVVDLGNAKAEALSGVLDSISPDDSVVVFTRFRHDLDRIIEAARANKRNGYELSGRNKQLADWRDDSSGAVLAVQIQAGGEGIDLSRSCYAVYYSPGLSRGDYEQSLARLHRPGQTRSVTYVHLVARDTVDEKIYEAFEKGRNIVEAVLSNYGGLIRDVA